MKLKTLICSFLSLSLLAGCASAPAASDQDTSGQTPEPTAESDTDSIVVYFSATGNTRKAAEDISELTGARLYELIPDQPYTAEDLDFNEDSSRVMQEYENPDERDTPLSNAKVSDWDQYDIVYLGYPIWWADAAWPVDHFAEDNNFTGKTVYPFCTSLSSPAGSSGTNLASMAGTGDWQPAERFAEDVSREDVQSWLVSIGQLSD